MNKFDKMYSEKPFYFGSKPSELVKKIPDLIPSPATVLDVGVGVGKDMFYLAKKGYVVEGVDVSQVAVDSCMSEFKKRNLSITCYCEDIIHFSFEKNYGIIYSAASLQFLDSMSDFEMVLSRIQAHTVFGGLNALAVPTPTLKGANFSLYVSLDSLQEYYSSWNVISSGEKIVTLANGNESSFAFIIARKK